MSKMRKILGIVVAMALLLSISVPLITQLVAETSDGGYTVAGATSSYGTVRPACLTNGCPACSAPAGEGKVAGVPNPAAVYCRQLGYQYDIREHEEGNQYGVCIFPDGSECDAWDFFKGKCGKDYSYCAKKGYGIETERVDKGSYYTECAVCVSKRGVEEVRIPMLELMEENGEALLDAELYKMEKEDTGEECRECEASNMERSSKDELPSTFDWRDVNGRTYIGPIHDQGSCGSCYAFAAAASAEGTYNWATGNYDGNCADFSESFIIWCLGRLPAYSSHFYGCLGSDWDYAELEALTVEGICNESDFPYTVVDPGECTHWGDPRTVFSSWHRVPCNDVEAIKTAIMTYGVVDAAVYVSGSFSGYTGGIYTDSNTTCPEEPCYYTYTNHAIALVGWGHDETDGDYWILRNSWGTGFGEDGYMRIAITSARVACEATYLIWSTAPPTMETIAEAEGEYYNTAPVLSNFGFDDNLALDDGWYQMDSFAGAWTALFTDATGTSWDSDNWPIPNFGALAEGSHTIYFKASDDAANVEGESGEWSWQFFKDTTPPTDPTAVTSTSHTVSTWSTDSTVDITWTDATDTTSGLDGYSILWDTSPTTIPNQTKNIEEGVETTTSSALADGNSHYFHIRSVDTAGNWQSTVHLGPFYIDTTPPTMETITEAEGEYYNTAPVLSNFGFDDNLALDDGWYQMDSFAGAWTALFTDAAGTSWDSDNWSIPNFGALAEGSHTIYFKASDDAANVEGESGEWSWQFYKDTTPPTDPTAVTSTSHTVSTWSTDSTVDITWTDATDTTSGLDGYSILWDTNSDTTPDPTKNIEEGVEATTSSALADGNSHYFHIRSVDNAGNWQSTVHLGPFYIDTTNLPTMETIAEAEGQYYNTAPVLSNFGFDDNLALDDGWYQMDSFAGAWTALFTDAAGTSWDSDNWPIPDFGALAEGSHTIYFKASDDAANVEGESGEWSWQFYKDTTPPTDPTAVTSPSHTVSTWSTDSTVDITWTDATDTTSGLDGYSVLWDTSSDTIPNQTKNIEEGVEATTSSALADGNSHYFHIRSVDNAGNWQSTVHLGPFFIDATPPTDPTAVTSTSHIVSTWSTDSTVDITWTDATDTTSGLDGYSVLWDTSLTTIPDPTKNIEEGVEATTSSALADGNSHYFHIRSVDNAGNWQSTVHLGPFFIDTTPPADPTGVTSPSHTTSTWSTDSTVDITWTDATDTTSGLDGYSVLWDTSSDTIPNQTKNIEEGVEATTSSALADGNSHYFHIRSVDNAGNWQSTVHLGPFFIDTTPPTDPTAVTSTSHTVSTWSTDSTVDITWTDSTDTTSGLDGYSILWDTSPTTIPDPTKNIEGGVETTTSSALADGNSHYFHIRSVDNAGNWQSTVHLGPFFIDTTNLPTMETIAEAEGQYYNTAPILSNFGFDDNLALDDGWYQMDSFAGAWTALFTDAAGTSWDSDNWPIPDFGALAEGSHTIYFKASDDAANVEGESGEWSWQFYKDTTPPTDPTAVTSTSHTVSTWSTDSTVDITWTDATDTTSGLDGYSILWDTNSDTIPDPTKNIEEGVEATTSSALADGNSHYFHIRSVDNAGNWQSTVHLGPFYIDTTPPTDPTAVTSTSHTVSTWSTDSTVDITWTDATDTTSGLDGYSILWDTSLTTIPDPTKNIEEGVEATTSSALADGNSHYFHIRSVDNAGNWQSTVHLGPFFIDATPPAAVTDLATSNPTRTSMGLIWTAPGDDANTGTASTYDIRYSTSNITAANWDSATQCTSEPTPVVAGNTETFTVTGLSDNTPYYFALKTVDKVSNWSTLSNVTSGTTQNSPPVLSSGAVSPISGYTSTTFTYSVTYTDADNEAPVSITVTIDGGTSDNMTVKAGEDGNLANGEIYEYTITGNIIGVGSHNFQFAASDGTDNATGDVGLHSGPTVSSPPTGGGGGGGTPPPTPLPPEEVTSETLLEQAEQNTEVASDSLEGLAEVNIEAGGDVLQGVAEQNPEIAGDLLGEVVKDNPEMAGDLVDEVAKDNPAMAGDILEQADVQQAAATMEEASADTLNNVIPEMSEESLIKRLPELSKDKLDSINTEVLFNSLPNAPTAQLTGEVTPEALEGLPDVVRVTADGEEYLAIRTEKNGWVIIAATPAPVDQLMIKTKQALTNVKTTVEVFEEQPSEVAVGLPAGQIVRAYVTITFENITPEDIEVGHMTFYVEKEWLEQNSIHKWSVVLNRCDPELGQWISLPTKKVREDDSKVYYTVVITRFSTFAISGSEALPPMNFEAANLTINPTEAKTGETVTITADVTNLSDTAGTYAVTLWINQIVETGTDIYLKAGETAPMSFTVTREVEGSYEVRVDRLFGDFTVTKAVPAPPTSPARQAPPTPAAFEVSQLSISPIEAQVGEEVIVSATVVNTGETKDSYTATLKINGVTVATKKVTVAGGKTTKVTFSVVRDVSGGYQVDIDGQTGSFTVAKAPLAWWIWLIVGLAVVAVIGVVVWLRHRAA